MVVLNRIYTRTGDRGLTRLATGAPVPKSDARVQAYGEVDETNACIGLCRLHTGSNPAMDAMLARIQNELFDLGADLATPPDPKPDWEVLRVTADQVTRIEAEIDSMNADLAPLTSFVLPGGSPLAAHLHLARTVCRRAERRVADLARDDAQAISPESLQYLNRLSDHLFVASRHANARAGGDVLWQPGATRTPG
ncbi:MAG TPA: cob(I)yrinic acid a,c-diamide adenosyltransferase [Brevundimonas sp.]|jgi:cob(I)alamin adenosyltransferase|uniref:cob(I)yrinic acid a,c-diamide adenosyltransferase n=1 Tax=Brevundimonas sp. TaxID=1871086 RepID=UPI002C937134|nr:cob(I)yrinic acid a,c-diamide adenosyltransferase [Brevundimonas sp.]HRH20230.1 cob(I)yrinic acid a,c-diamide adenosyltransferase [Brevundimonas sp.]